MKLLEIDLKNFRQFAGDQRFDLATSHERNVTLIFGANGSGKTTLLNAFLWAMYGELSQDLEHQDRLITDTVWEAATLGQEISAAVEVVFEHNDKTYRVRREVRTTKSSGEQSRLEPKLTVRETASDGATAEITAGRDKIDSILPHRLSRFFFFNGERIEHLVSKSAYAEVKQAIKTLLGLEQVERALDHLPAVERKLTRELKKIGGDEAGQIADQLNSARETRAQLSQSVDHLEGQVASLQEERTEVLERLRQHLVAGPLQEQRAGVERQLAEHREAERLQKARRRKLIAERGFIAFTTKAAAKTAEIADSLRRKGDLPAPIKREFVESLLEQARCICGTDLTPGSEAHHEVTGWRARAGLAEVESAWQQLSGELTYLDDERGKLRPNLHDAAAALVETRQHIEYLEEQKTQLDGEIAKLPQEDVSRLESKQQELETHLFKVKEELGRTRHELEEENARIESLNNRLRNAEIKDELAEKARKRVEVVQDVHNALQRILEIRTETVRNELDQRIKMVFRQITVKPYMPELTAEFELGLFQKIDGELHPVAKSTGENQILSLSFVAAVSQLARETRDQQTSDGPYQEGGAFPIVMDAAFGSLDENYQREVSRALPAMAPQMLVLVSKSQGQHVVMEELDPHVGRIGVITVHSTNVDQDPEDIDLQDRSYPYIRTRSDRDWAELVEVN